METLSEWRIREEAGARKWPTSHAQFQSYVDWGLLLPALDSRWPADAVDRLVEIREAQALARTLPRRLVRLRSNYLAFPVSPALLRKAMIEMAGPRSIAAPKRKLKRMNTALDRVLAQAVAGAYGSGRGGYPTGRQYPNYLPVPERWVNPHPSRWQKILRQFDDDHYFETRAAFQYHTDHSCRIMGAGIWPTDEDIPLEERILLLTVRELSIDWGRAIAGLLHAVKNYRRPDAPLVSPVAAAVLSSDEPHAELYVVLADGALPPTTTEQRKLKEELRTTVNDRWMPATVHFVDTLPTVE